MTQKHPYMVRIATASNGAEIGFSMAETLYTRRVYNVKLIGGKWPTHGELIQMADGIEKVPGYFGGGVEKTAYPEYKRVFVFTD